MDWAKFLGRPTRGGWLTIMNCCCLALFMLLVHWSNPNPKNTALIIVLTSVMILLLSPLSILFWMPGLGPTQLDQIVFQAVTAGLNAILWGYGISWMLGWFGRLGKNEGSKKPFFEW